MEFLVAWTHNAEEAYVDFVMAESKAEAFTKWREKNAALDNFEIESIIRVRNDEEVY